MREIGSEFWDVPISDVENDLFPISTQWFLSGRSALIAIIKDLKRRRVKTVAIPSWCCDSMIVPFINGGIEVDFYPVYIGEKGLTQEIDKNCDALLVMDYFGYTLEPLDLSDYKGIVIRDVTHSVFSFEHSDAEYYFGSLRKWCGVYTGGYAWGRHLEISDEDVSHYVYLREKAMQEKKKYILDDTENTGKGYLDVFETAENYLEVVGAAPAAETDIKRAKNLDVALIRKKRRANAKILRNAFRELLLFPDMKETDTPLFVPIVLSNRDEVRKHLINNDIYCPVHWPLSKYHKINESEIGIYDKELSLICDQRYNEEDMYRMVDAINKFLRRDKNAHSLYK